MWRQGTCGQVGTVLNFFSACHLFALLLLSVPILPLGDLLLPISVSVTQVEMHWSRALEVSKSISTSVKNH